ncbi:TIGR04104 family putative zinc finger protein [Paenibacillus wulumuqiensis]|uniref:TIGR04104 family putative zinc finger protein n=1 Tax=Paenibacillus wulumuqiensis TaxID=1567107 RepID=UPI0009E55D0D
MKLKLPICPHCQYSFSWGSVMKTLWRFDGLTKCPQCGIVLYPIVSRRWHMSLSTFIMLCICFGMQMVGVAFSIIVPVFLLCALIAMLLIPYWYSYYDEDRH